MTENFSTKEAVTAAVRDSIPIAFGYFTVALAVGIYCARIELPLWLAAVMSATSLSSSGQFAGITAIATDSTYLQLAIGVGLVNLRYVLMSISLGQRLGPKVGIGQRMLIAWGVTDEIYALAMGRRKVGATDYIASMVLPIIGWTSGTVVGALVGSILPPILVSATSVLLYAMFIAIVVPPAQESRPVLIVVLAAAVVSAALTFVPWLDVSWRVIIVTAVVAAIAATLMPHKTEDGDQL